MTQPPAPSAIELATAHALAWLVVGNAVGLLLAGLQLLPGLNLALAPWTYGRWIPVHLNAQLYGWTALPLVGLLLRLYGERQERAWLSRLAVSAWSAALAVGCLSWLAGESSGKPFLEWRGAARWALVAAMALLAAALVAAFGRRLRRLPGAQRRSLAVVLAGALLAALIAIPAVTWWVTNPEVYPAYNPDSGGATGGSLLGSSLAVVAIFYLAPAAIGLVPRGGWRALLPDLALLGLHGGWFALLDHGNHSHHEWLQIASLASLAIWPLLLLRFFRRFAWPSSQRLWLRALAWWGCLLVATGILVFLPGVLERAKFTNALVAHAHLAMAGMASSFLMLVIGGLAPGGQLRRAIGSRRAFWLWQLGGALQILALIALAVLEVSDSGALIRGGGVGAGLLSARLLAGVLMFWASLEWLRAAVRRRPVGSFEGSVGLAAAEVAV